MECDCFCTHIGGLSHHSEYKMDIKMKTFKALKIYVLNESEIVRKVYVCVSSIILWKWDTWDLYNEHLSKASCSKETTWLDNQM